MFEKEIKFIADVNLNKIKSLGSLITFDKLSNSDVHPAIVQYISAELDYLIHEDRKKLLEQSVFDYSGSEVSKHFNAIGQEIKKNKKILFEDIKKLILQAVSFNVNFLMRPKWSLTKLVYNEADTKNIDELKLLLNYVYFYEYIKSVFFAYTSKRKLIALSSTEFEAILGKIDKEIFTSQQQKFIDFALYTMSEFFNSGDINKNTVHPAAIELFLKEKNLIDPVYRLRKAFPDGTKQQVSVEEIKRVIYSTEPVEHEVEIPAEEQHETKTVEVKDDKIPEKAAEEMPAQNGKKVKVETKEEEKIKEKTEEIIETKMEEKIEKVNKKVKVKTKKDLMANVKDEIKEKKIEDKIELNIEDKAEELLDKKLEETKEGVEFEDTEIEAVLDENLLAFYESELKSLDLDEDIPDLDVEKEAGSEPSDKEDIEEMFDFEEETKELLNDFSSAVEDEESEDAIKNHLNVEQPETEKDNEEDVENLTRSFLEEEEENAEDHEVEDDGFNEETGEEIDEKLENEIKDFGKAKRKFAAKDIFDFMSDKEIEKIVSNVFNDDREDFATTMEKLTECRNYEEATDILKSVFLTYRINPYSKEAVTLTNSVSNYFDQG